MSWGGATPLRSTSWEAYRVHSCCILECTYFTNNQHLPNAHFTNPPTDGTLSQPASFEAGIQTCYWLSYLGRSVVSWFHNPQAPSTAYISSHLVFCFVVLNICFKYWKEYTTLMWVSCTPRIRWASSWAGSCWHTHYFFNLLALKQGILIEFLWYQE